MDTATNNLLRRILLAAVMISACSQPQDPVSSTDAPVLGSPAGVSAYYDRDVQRVFEKSCVGGCHEPGGTGERQTGLVLTSADSYRELFDATASKNGPQVVPGDADNSLLVWKLEGVDLNSRKVFGERMPLGRPALSSSEIAAIRTWILEGALRTIAPPVPPTVLSVSSGDSTHVEVLFSEEVVRATAENSKNYSILGERGLSVLGATLVSAELALLTTEVQLPGVYYTLVVSGVSDLSGDFVRAGEGDSGVFRFTPEVSFVDQIQPIFNQSCAFVTCHSNSATFPPGEGLILDQGFSRANLVGRTSRQKPAIQLINPESPAESYLMQKLQGATGISGEQMPLGGPYLLSSQIRLFQLWAEQGAREN